MFTTTKKTTRSLLAALAGISMLIVGCGPVGDGAMVPQPQPRPQGDRGAATITQEGNVCVLYCTHSSVPLGGIDLWKPGHVLPSGQRCDASRLPDELQLDVGGIYRWTHGYAATVDSAGACAALARGNSANAKSMEDVGSYLLDNFFGIPFTSNAIFYDYRPQTFASCSSNVCYLDDVLGIERSTMCASQKSLDAETCGGEGNSCFRRGRQGGCFQCTATGWTTATTQDCYNVTVTPEQPEVDVACTADSQCAEGQLCNASGVCESRPVTGYGCGLPDTGCRMPLDLAAPVRVRSTPAKPADSSNVIGHVKKGSYPVKAIVKEGGAASYGWYMVEVVIDGRVTCGYIGGMNGVGLGVCANDLPMFFNARVGGSVAAYDAALQAAQQ